MEQTFIRGRNRECSSGARESTPPTAAFIAIVSKSVPITSPTISSGNGVIVAARHAITFSIVLCSSEKCEWARTCPTSARARLRPKNLRRRPQVAVLLQHLQHKEQRVRLPLHKQLRLRLRVRREQHQPHRPGLHLPLVRLHHRPHRRRPSGLALLRRHLDKWRT